MSKQFGNSGECSTVYLLSRDLAKRCPYVVRIQTKWLSEPSFSKAINRRVMLDRETDDRYSHVLQIVRLLSQYRYADPDTDREARNIALKPTIDTL